MHFKLLVKRLLFELFFWTFSPIPYLFYVMRAFRTNRWHGNIWAKLLLIRQAAYDRVFNQYKFPRKP
ncbi:hypothetical protein BWI93_10285 [Siphonobacter sp. BAB-5385]|uniref:hypothetical protein n=1 Tax=Siphonobacter sp. BAB-5385 TaxID=1864822 RepID=UPI000B9DD208|nr:hypothetical protein [Siphonobacter sp. BAB-5385]OZI08246.1 hypothetical protein BWI93_10285 [Siphonobacter sp. BAB-5385]